MFVSVDVVAGTVSLEEAADCARFHLSARGAAGPSDLAAVGDVLEAVGVGRLAGPDGADALIDVAAVRRLAAGRVGEGWSSDFERMLTYAASKGWLHDAAIQTHIEWSS